MGNYFLYGLLGCFLVYELVMHFALKNRRGDETMSHIIRRQRWYVRLIGVPIVLIALYLHLSLRLF